MHEVPTAAVHPDHVDATPAALTPLGVLSAGERESSAADRVTPYRIALADGYGVSITPSLSSPEMCLRVSAPDGSFRDVWMPITTAEHLADALAWTAQEQRLAEAM